MYICVDCGKTMEKLGDLTGCLSCGKTYPVENGIMIAWPSGMSELAKDEVKYHDEFDENASEVHQLDSYRNIFYHQMLWNWIKVLPKGNMLLEIGAGSGMDAQQFVSDYKLVLSDISPKTLERLHGRLSSPHIRYVAVDGVALPFADNTFGGVYMSAVWHHIEDPQKALNEFGRVLQPGGRIGIAVEPNSFYFLPMKFLRPLLCRATHSKIDEGSHADAEMTGFSYRKIADMFSSDVWENVEIRPMWLFAGWMHYTLEFVYRVFKLKQRVTVPVWFEKIVVGLDEVLFKIPGVKHLCWHWVVLGTKACHPELVSGSFGKLLGGKKDAETSSA